MDVYLLYAEIDYEGIITDIEVFSSPEKALEYITTFMNRPGGYATTVYEWVPVKKNSPDFKLKVVSTNSPLGKTTVKDGCRDWILAFKTVDSN